MLPHTPPVLKFCRLKEVLDLTGMSERELYRRVADGRFPQPKRDGKRSFWTSTEVFEWQLSELERLSAA